MKIKASVKKFFAAITLSMMLIFLVSCSSEGDNKTNGQQYQYSQQTEIQPRFKRTTSQTNESGNKKEEVTWEFKVQKRRIQYKD